MPNWCYSAYHIVGKRKEVQSLYSKMNNLEKRRKPLVESDFGKTWLGCLVTKLGGDWNKVYCRGSWSELEFDGEAISFNTETAWGPMDEVFRLVKSVYPSLKIYYSAEEEMMCVYVTNDKDGKYFNDRYKLDIGYECEYFATIENVCQYVSRIVGRTLTTKSEIEDTINEWNRKTYDDDMKIYLNEFKIVEDENL